MLNIYGDKYYSDQTFSECTWSWRTREEMCATGSLILLSRKKHFLFNKNKKRDLFLEMWCPSGFHFGTTHFYLRDSLSGAVGQKHI